jgi:hypothetical protein
MQETALGLAKRLSHPGRWDLAGFGRQQEQLLTGLPYSSPWAAAKVRDRTTNEKGQMCFPASDSVQRFVAEGGQEKVGGIGKKQSQTSEEFKGRD